MRIVLTCILILITLPAKAVNKVALVVGMSNYQSIVKLDNAANDARAIASTLNDIGFRVTTVMEGTYDEFRTALDEFSFRAETADLALVYFAGHGVEVQGENFLIPVDAAVQSNRDIQRQALSLKEILAAVDNARKMRIVILDSCRDNPFGGALDLQILQETTETVAQTRSAGRGGLAAPEPDRGTLVAYAARDGEVALDGAGENSPFALALMEQLPKAGLEISLMFRKVRDQVVKATYSRQEPYTYGSLSGTPFYLAGAATDDSTVSDADPRIAWSDILPDQETQLVSLSEQGDTRSMVGLAYIRLNPDDTRYAPSEAVEFLTRASDAGSAEAQFELAKLYEIGLGVEPDGERALALFKASAEQDFPDALNDLGFMYFQGNLGVPRDPALALNYFERAANERHPEAMFNFAALIDDGLVSGFGSEEAAGYLYQSLRSGNQQVYQLLRDQPTMFKPETRKALQARLADNAFYAGAIDGDFGAGTQRGIRAAFGLEN